MSVDAAAQTAAFTFSQPIPVGSYRLAMSYTGKLGTQATGLFAIDYDTRAGKQRALYTQFENSDARRFIPSWGEPAYKATFDLQVTVPSGQMAVSNMPAASTTDLGNGLGRVRFQPSPKMSTYLLFFGLGDFDRVTTMSDGTEIGMITQKGLAALAGLGDTRIVDEARRRYVAQATDPQAVPAALRKTIYAVVAGHADAATWDKLHAAAKAETTPLIKDRLYSLLSRTEDETLAWRVLDLALTDEPGVTNSAGMIGDIARRHPDLAFDFAVAHRAQVDKLVDSTSRSRYYPEPGSGSFDPAMIDKIRAYADAHVAAGSRRAAETAIANVRYRAMVRDKRLPAVDAWLLENGG